ncbi:MAG TPA: hypothetical protein VMO26_24195 [Vicinamibacterales bacterium]|nr:hypothetical protein [Vicinamibacterales bacterium]
MADTTDRKDQDDSTRIAPRSVDPQHRDKVGSDADQSTSDDRGRRVRREPDVVEADGGDIAGVAGGGIDSGVSGLGGDKKS